MRAFVFAMAVLGAFFAVSGCNRPETTAEERGTIVTELPNLPNKPETLPLPEGVDEDCPVKAKREMLKNYPMSQNKAEQSAESAPAETAPAENQQP